MHQALRENLRNDLQTHGYRARDRRRRIAVRQENGDTAAHRAQRAIRAVVGWRQGRCLSPWGGRTAAVAVTNHTERRREFLIGEVIGDTADVVTHQKTRMQQDCKHGENADLSMPMAQGHAPIARSETQSCPPRKP